jgi:hypothetical protein
LGDINLLRKTFEERQDYRETEGNDGSEASPPLTVREREILVAECFQ